jgi:mycofactocin biosynthetic radical S-adenosylmethionine protein MftC
MAAKFFTGLPLDGPDPECVKGHGEYALSAAANEVAPRPSGDHSHRSGPAGSRPVPVSIGLRPPTDAGLPPDRACDESPLAGFRAGPG